MNDANTDDSLSFNIQLMLTSDDVTRQKLMVSSLDV